MKACVFILFVTFSLTSSAQEVNLLMEGSVYGNKGLPLANAQVEVYNEQHELVATMETPPNGRFRFELTFDQEFEIVFRRSNFHAKLILVDTKGMTDEKKKWGYEFGNIRVELMPGNTEDKPEQVARIYYDSGAENFMYEQ